MIRIRHGFVDQVPAGIFTCLLLTVHWHKQHGGKVSMKRVRKLCCKLKNELAILSTMLLTATAIDCPAKAFFMQKHDRSLLTRRGDGDE
jgi:hypothetical protein